MNKLISTFEQLYQLQTNAVEDLSKRLSTQKQLSQRFEKNIAALTSLAEGVGVKQGDSALLMINQSRYKRNIQSVIDWQKQEQALSDLKLRDIKHNLLQEAKREKSLELVMQANRAELQRQAHRTEQKLMDASSAQHWLCRKIAQRHGN
ncbi:flagellar export protein FliJ [Chania multitudinisentens RB-25]|uniref:Flagellar export protein FliJ n=1 Tax=Chania multitudinisentens RB-25 TaxID=1441930 RepID=W0L772_9GAMM|nr:flagellar export protein FliJ [Chania multitudinisentens]AHG19663.1 flagellar export protein FliJ [Chania multitudinisentens RB-25]